MDFWLCGGGGGEVSYEHRYLDLSSPYVSPQRYLYLSLDIFFVYISLGLGIM